MQRDETRAAAEPRVSVVVPTFERATLLPGLIGALEAQTLPRSEFEVIIVDDGSADGTASVLEDLRRRSPLEIVVRRLPSNRGAATARNEGVSAARGTLVAFTDDDCRPDKGWLSAGVAAMETGAGFVVGATEPESDQRNPFERILRVSRVAWCPTANVFYRRSDVLHVGGFNPDMTTAEDTDLAMRMAAHGREARFVPGALVTHLNRGGTLASALRIAWRWTDIPLLFKRHPTARRGLAHRQVFWKQSHVPAATTLLGLLALPVLRWAWLLALPHLWYRLRKSPATADHGLRVLTLPGVMLVDVTEVITCIRGSARHRTFLL